jgi:ribonuclease P protein component
MLAKKNRANTETVDNLFKSGKFIHSSLLTFKYILKSGSTTRISVLVPKSIAKKAVERNILRRRGYQALKKHLTEFPIGVAGVLVFKKPVGSVIEVENEIKTILTKIH